MKLFTKIKEYCIRLWNKWFKKPQPPVLSKIPIQQLTPKNVDNYSRQPEFSLSESQARFYCIRNPKTRMVFMDTGTIESLKRKYPQFEVVEPLIK